VAWDGLSLRSHCFWCCCPVRRPLRGRRSSESRSPSRRRGLVVTSAAISPNWVFRDTASSITFEARVTNAGKAPAGESITRVSPLGVMNDAVPNYAVPSIPRRKSQTVRKEVDYNFSSSAWLRDLENRCLRGRRAQSQGEQREEQLQARCTRRHPSQLCWHVSGKPDVLRPLWSN
jgi:hypothetical protein